MIEGAAGLLGCSAKVPAVQDREIPRHKDRSFTHDAEEEDDEAVIVAAAAAIGSAPS